MNAWQLQKKANWFNGRAKFNQEETKGLNIEAYDLGAAHVMEAAAELFGLGRKRLDETKETLDRVSHLELYEYAETYSAFNNRRHYTRQEVQTMNRAAYSLGVEHTTTAAEYTYRLGETRRARLEEKLREFQISDLAAINTTGNVFEAKLARDKRRAANPSRKGAVLDEQQ